MEPVERQLTLPIEQLGERDDAYRAELDRVRLPKAAKRVAAWILTAGHAQQTDRGERLFAVRDGTLRRLAGRSGIPRSTLDRGLRELGRRKLLYRVRGCLCLAASQLCEMEGTSTDVVPQAPTDDWGRVHLPARRSPERPTDDACPSLSQLVPGLSQLVPTCPRSVPACPNLSQSDRASISARPRLVVVVEEKKPNNNNPDPAAVKELAGRAWRKIHAPSRYPPRADRRERTLLLRCALLALGHFGERWILSAAAARPLRGERQDPIGFFRAAAAYQAWEQQTDTRPDTPEEQAQAKREFRDLLHAIELPAELARRNPERTT